MEIIRKMLIYLYRFESNFSRKIIFSFIYRLDKSPTTSSTLRAIFSKYYNIEIGLYTMGGCFNPFHFDKFTKIGRYCSIAQTAFAFNRNHPIDKISTHAYFFNTNLGYCKNDINQYIPLEIKNDVWIGHNAIIMPNVKVIGNGAIIGAGAVIHKDVPDYAIVVGNPARVVRYRFNQEIITKLLKSKWWEKSIEKILPDFHKFTIAFNENNGNILNEYLDNIIT